MQERLEQFEDDLLALSHMTPYAAINYIRKAIGYDEFLEEYAQFRHIKVEELYEILDELSDLAKPFQNYKEWFENMEQYALELEKQVKKKYNRRMQ